MDIVSLSLIFEKQNGNPENFYSRIEEEMEQRNEKNFGLSKLK